MAIDPQIDVIDHDAELDGGAVAELDVIEHDSTVRTGATHDETALTDVVTDDDPTAAEDVPIDQASALGPARYVEMTIIAQDPKVRDDDGAILRARVRVAADLFRAPFQTHRFHVVSYDAEKAAPGADLKLLDRALAFRDRFAGAADSQLLENRDFHAQNVFAVASRTLAAFEGALGRRVPWDFGAHQLYLIPHGDTRPNAFYSASKRALVFGRGTDDAGKAVYACLSHDIIAHETTHAILDGLRPGYFTPGLPDQGGFHEGFADVVALLSIFAVPAVVEHAVAGIDQGDQIHADEMTRERLRSSVLFQLAEQFGQAVHGHDGRPLRESLTIPAGSSWRSDPRYNEVHNRGEVLVAAIGHALLDMWFRRLQHLLATGPATRRLVAEEGAKAAEHLLRMVIRAIDYCPPLEFEYEDFIDAIMFSDTEVAPDDEHGYRQSVLGGFARYDIHLPPRLVIDVRRLKKPPRYSNFNYAALRSDRDEVFRFIWENDEGLGIDLRFQTAVESLRPSIRVGPDGFVVQETVVTYTQELQGSAGEIHELSRDPAFRYRGKPGELNVPGDLDPGRPIALFGGGAIIFDQFGRLKVHLHKPLLDWDRQSRRLAFLVRKSASRPGSVLGARSYQRGEPLAALHRPERFADERW